MTMDRAEIRRRLGPEDGALMDALIDGFADEINSWRPGPGYYLIKLAKGGAEVPAAVIQHETEPGNPTNHLDMPFAQSYLNGEPVEDKVLRRARFVRNIDAREYHFLVRDFQWLRENAPDDPRAKPREAVDLSKVAIPF